MPETKLEFNSKSTLETRQNTRNDTLTRKSNETTKPTDQQNNRATVKKKQVLRGYEEAQSVSDGLAITNNKPQAERTIQPHSSDVTSNTPNPFSVHQEGYSRVQFQENNESQVNSDQVDVHGEKLRERSFREQHSFIDKHVSSYRLNPRAKSDTTSWSHVRIPSSYYKRKTFGLEEKTRDISSRENASAVTVTDQLSSKTKISNQKTKPSAGTKLRFKKETSSAYQSALHFDDPLEVKKTGLARRSAGALTAVALEGTRSKLKESTDDNVGLHALDGTDRTIRTSVYMARTHRQNSTFKTIKKSERLRAKALSREAGQAADQVINKSGNTNPVSKYFQKKRIQRKYLAQAKKTQQANQARKRGKRAKDTTEKVVSTIRGFTRKKDAAILAVALVAFLFLGSVFSFLFSATTMFGAGAIGGIAGTPTGGKIFLSPFDFDWTPYVTSTFGLRTHPVSGEENTFHTGLDLGVAGGTPIRAVQSGTVIQATNGTTGYGRYVLIHHDNGYQTLYAHCSELLVSVGQKVTMGETIAKVGTTGTSTGNHLHIEVRRDGEFLDPYPLLSTGNEVNTGSQAMVDVAASQIGNVGGQPYWSWYGFSSRVEWCAVFVSWCAGQNGYIDAGAVPKFAGCIQGSNWFKERGLWMPRGYLPLSGEIIFFDWDGDNLTDHVGIVETCDGTTVYTIEGNASDSCKRRTYSVNSPYIYGYATPIYP